MQQQEPKESILIISQIKAFGHYIWCRDKQNTVRELNGIEPMQLTLPSLRGDKTKDIGKVHLETRYLWIDCESVERYHGYKVVNAVKANVAL